MRMQKRLKRNLSADCLIAKSARTSCFICICSEEANKFLILINYFRAAVACFIIRANPLFALMLFICPAHTAAALAHTLGTHAHTQKLGCSPTTAAKQCAREVRVFA